jgi:hypothetical protein
MFAEYSLKSQNAMQQRLLFIHGSSDEVSFKA